MVDCRTTQAERCHPGRGESPGQATHARGSAHRRGDGVLRVARVHAASVRAWGIMRPNLAVREVKMARTVAQTTQDELRDMIETIVERKLIDMFGDPDEGLILDPGLRERLTRQMQAVAAGGRGIALDEVAAQLGLD
jgi:hypothetical protein